MMGKMKKKSVSELIRLGYELLAYSTGGDLLVQSFVAIYRGKRVHAWFSHKLRVYEFD